jgi:hypothetical protein
MLVAGHVRASGDIGANPFTGSAVMKDLLGSDGAGGWVYRCGGDQPSAQLRTSVPSSHCSTVEVFGQLPSRTEIAERLRGVRCRLPLDHFSMDRDDVRVVPS